MEFCNEVTNIRLFYTILIAVFPAIAAIITSFDGLFQWKDNYTRFSQTAEALKSEKAKYLTRTTRRYYKVSKPKSLNNFVTTVEKIVMEETSDWRALVEKSMDLEDLIDVARGETETEDEQADEE